MTARMLVSNGSTLPGARRPGRTATRRRHHGFGGERRIDRLGVGVEIEQPADPLHGRVEVGPVSESELGSHVVVRRSQRDRAMAAGEHQSTVGT